MTINATHPDEYIEKIEDPVKKEAIIKLREVIKSNLPAGFEEGMSYGMIGYYIPHVAYPAGYHCNPALPLPFLNIAAQKNFIAVYHMGIYANKKLYDWFVDEHAKRSSIKLDMGKSCIRYKKAENLPFELIGELVAKITPRDWIDMYETAFKSQK